MKNLLHAFILTLATIALASSAPAGELSPAQRKIEWAQKAIAKKTNDYRPYNDLALALALRARETSDTAFYSQAEEALKKSFQITPENFEGLKAQVWLLLGKHEFARACEKASALNKRVPDDIQVYGFLVDANAELGEYGEAEKAAQWMLDMRPGNIPGLTRAAYLRELFGDVDGALDLMTQAFEATPAAEVEDQAWILTQIGHLYLSMGKLDEAERALTGALAVFPGYHYALANLAKVRTGQRKYGEAVELLRRRYQAAPHAENLYDLATALERAGQNPEAQEVYSEFEAKALRESQLADNANRELIFYYADYAHKPPEALRVARLEKERRHDVYTLDAYGWALHMNGAHAEARREIEKALAVGIRDAKLLYHAGVITSAMNEPAAARKYFEECLQQDPHYEHAADVRRALAHLSGAPRANFNN